MTAPLRRIVTGLDEAGRSAVLFDDRPGMVIWTNAATPVDNDGRADAGTTPFAMALPGSSGQFIFSDIPPANGTPAFLHATDTIDYGIVLSGSITLVLETGETTVHAGDVVVMRGVVHGWRNDGTTPCRIASVMLAARPVADNAR